MCGAAKDDAYDEDGNDYASQNNFPETDYTGEDDGHIDAIIVDKSGQSVDADTPREAYYSDDSEKLVVDWYDETIEAMGGDSTENMDDIERQACMFEDECLGGTKGYSPQFQAIWKVKEPRCKTIVDAINNGSLSIQHESWRQDMVARFGCPEPTNSTHSTSNTDSWSSSESGSSSTESETWDNEIQLPDLLADFMIHTLDD